MPDRRPGQAREPLPNSHSRRLQYRTLELDDATRTEANEQTNALDQSQQQHDPMYHDPRQDWLIDMGEQANPSKQHDDKLNPDIPGLQAAPQQGNSYSQFVSPSPATALPTHVDLVGQLRAPVQTNEESLLEYAEGFINTTPSWAAINLLTIDITAEELLTFFPRHYRWDGYLKRLYANGWDHLTIAAYVNGARDINSGNGLSSSAIKRAMKSLEIPFEDQNNDRSTAQLDSKAIANPDLTTSKWTFAKPDADYRLAHLAKGVIHYPEGAASGALTLCILYAQTQPKEEYSLSDVPIIMESQGIKPLERIEGSNPDKEAVEAFKAMKWDVSQTILNKITGEWDASLLR